MNLKKNIFNAITIILLAALIAGAVLLNNRIKKLETQMSYTSDNTSVILSDVQTMQDDIKSTLEEEASLITDWDISLKSADFTDMTYTVSVSVVPKEYTEDTKTSVFFGTNEIPLELNGIKYTGEATLPLSEDYAGNVTFLFVDGNKRSTEVLDEFEGVTSVFKNVASGILANKPTFDNGSIKLGTDVDVAVMGNDYFDFNSVQLVVASSDTELKTYDIRQLLAENGTDSADSADTDSITSALSRKDDAKKDGSKNDTENDTSDASKEDDGKLHSLEGTVKIDSGNFDWKASGKFPQLTEPDPCYHGIRFCDVAGNASYIIRIRAILLRDTGAAISPFNAFLLLQGLETLSLRVERHVANALQVVDYLSKHPKVEAVHHPSLPQHPDNKLYKRYFPKGGGSIFTIDIKGGIKEAQRFIDSLEIFSLLANVADMKSLVIHPATTTHSQLNEKELEEQHIKPGTVRLSIGTEHIDDLIADLAQALEKV